MGILSITPVGGTSAIGGRSARSTRPTSRRGGSAFGPAFILGGSTASLTEGLYNSLGSFLSATRPSLPSGKTGKASPAERKRAASLTVAAAKITIGDAAGGRAIAEKLLDTNATDVGAIHVVARSFLAERNYDQAERYFARASGLAPNNATLRNELAAARSLKKDDADAIADARRKLASPAHRADGLRLLSYLSDRSPTNAEVDLALADGFAAARQPAQVVRSLGSALRHASGHQIDEIVSRARQLVEDHPQSSVVHNLLGRALDKAGRRREALSELKTAVDIIPNHAPFRQDLANSHLAQATDAVTSGDLISAQKNLSAAIDLDPANRAASEVSSRVSALRAERDVRTGQFAKALTDLGSAAVGMPDDPGFRKKLASLYSRTGAHFENAGSDAQALKSFTKAFELDPEAGAARRKVGELSHTAGLNALGRLDFDQAIVDLDRAFQAFPNNDTYRQDLAGAFDQRGQQRVTVNQVTTAIDDFKQAVALDPTNSAFLTNLSNALDQQSSP